jgi:hypothetical protein
VLVRESEAPPAPAELAEHLRVYLDALGAPPDELAGLDLDALVERATARVERRRSQPGTGTPTRSRTACAARWASRCAQGWLTLRAG